jgi:diguanylate cyclase (GGDEF)-like protein
MMPLDAWAFALAVPIFTGGAIGGWLLRGRFLGWSLGERNGQEVHSAHAEGNVEVAGNGLVACDIAARRTRIAKAIEPAHRDSAHAATARDRIAETAMPSVRTTFSLALGHRLAESARSGDPLSLILVRIDNYQAVYDHYGLQASNQILDAAGTFFVGSVREMDWVARFDRTTFAFLLPRTAHANALRVAERMRTRISSSALSVNGTSIPLTLSLGTTEAALGDSSDAILRRAEEAMNAAIQKGGNCVHSHACDGVEVYAARGQA